MIKNKELSDREKNELMDILKSRFETNMHRHKGLDWFEIQKKLEKSGNKLWSLNEMEKTGGEPDILAFDKPKGEYVFYDCSPESPNERRSLCYDREALNSRKANKPQNSVMDMADQMGIEILTEEQYRYLQKFENFDQKTSSWLKTPAEIRELGGAVFGDFRYNQVFIYHNGAESYYAARGFRGLLRI